MGGRHSNCHNKISAQKKVFVLLPPHTLKARISSSNGTQGLIYSLSLGVTRIFQLKDEKERITEVHLASGSLLYMGGDTQQHWRHRILRQPNICLARINLPFRTIVS